MICEHSSYPSLKIVVDFHTHSGYLPRTGSLSVSITTLIKGGKRVFLSSMCAKYKLMESENRYEFPELSCGGQTWDTANTSAAAPLILAVAFLWLFAVIGGQKPKLASKCNVCAYLQHFTHRYKWDGVRFTVF